MKVNLNWKRISIPVLIILLIVIVSTILVYIFRNNMKEYFNPIKQETQALEVSPTENETGMGDHIILYYAMWCGYSRSFLPEWEKFETYAKSNLPNLKVMRLRCEDGDEATCQQKGIEGYPSIILYKANGDEVEFRQERSADKVIEFCKKNLN